MLGDITGMCSDHQLTVYIQGEGEGGEKEQGKGRGVATG